MRRHRFALIGAVTLAVMITAFPLPSCVKESDAPQPPQVAKVPAPPEFPGEDDSVSPPALIDEAMVLPEYPKSEKDAGIEGSVMLKAEILKDGSVGEITVVEGVEGHPALEESAIKAFRQWRFSPATEDGQPVDMTIQIPIAFRLDNHGRGDGDTGAAGGTKADETMPQLITESIVTPEYPEEARDAGVTGRMLLETEVLPDGTPGKITIKEGIPGYPGFDQMAIEAVRQWRFTPGTRDGKPVTCTVMIPVEFSLDDKN